MVGLKRRDIDRDVLMIFAISYEYSISFTNLLKLFKISREYFWTFMEICSPMLKMGVRKASMLRKSVDKLLPYLTGEGEKDFLTAREENMLEHFTWFIEESFTDGDGCLTLDQITAIPSALGFTEKDMCVASSSSSFKNNIDSIKYIKIGDNKFFKTSRVLYYLEKYCGDLDLYQINNLSMRDIIRRVDDGERDLLEAAK